MNEFKSQIVQYFSKKMPNPNLNYVFDNLNKDEKALIIFFQDIHGEDRDGQIKPPFLKLVNYPSLSNFSTKITSYFYYFNN